jgi:pyruvate-formate lyase
MSDPILQTIQRRLFGAEDSVCLERAELVTEAWREHADAPAPIRRARALAHVLSHMTLDLHTNPVFAGNTSSRPGAWMLVPEHGADRVDVQIGIEHDDLRGFLDGKVPQDLLDFWRDRSSRGGLGHLCVDYRTVVHRGLQAVLDQLERLEGQGTHEQQTYRAAMRIGLEAVIDWAGRYADAADRAANEASEEEAAWLRRVSDACRRVPRWPARNLHEGLQAIALIHLAIAIEGHGLSVSIGLPDRVLVPFADEARDDPDRASFLMGAFALKIAMNTYQGRGSKTQAITVGGRNSDGRCQCNALTLAMLRGFDRVAVSDPHLFLRWHPGLDEEVFEQAMAMLHRGRSMPLLINDEPTIRGFVEAGVDTDDASEYAVMGCNELGIPGKLFDSALPVTCTWIDAKILRDHLLSGGADGAGDVGRIVESLEPSYAQIEASLEKRQEVQRQIAEAMPTPLTSSLMCDGPVRGADLMVAMPYRTPCIYDRGLVNAVNALAAIESIVFEKRAMTLEALIEAQRDPKLSPAVRALIDRAPKWGQDDRADRWMSALLALRRRVLDREAREGRPRPMVCHVIRSLHHLDGARIGTTLDGRDAGQPLADSIGPPGGTNPAGPTALLEHVLRIDAARDFPGGYNLNLSLSRALADPATLSGLTRGFFLQGGQELQINVLSASELREAQQQPEEHGNLVVRIAGLNARFVELSIKEQSELIARAEAAEALQV